MPRYEYYCKACMRAMVLQHLSDEVLADCPKCSEEGTLEKKLSSFRTVGDKQPEKRKIGETTEDFIKHAREELQRQKQQMDDKR